MRLTWRAVGAASSYRVVRNGLRVASTTRTSFTDALLWPQTHYEYSVEAIGGRGAVLRRRRGRATTRALPATGFPRPFAANGIWNTPVGSARVHPRSAALTAFFLRNAASPNMSLHAFAVSVAEARAGDPTHTVPCTLYRCTLHTFGALPIPHTARPDPSEDGHLVIYDPVNKREWDFWQGKTGSGGWSASAGAAVSTLGDGIAPVDTASGNAANFPLLGGIVRPEELAQGRIDHALVFMMPNVSKRGYVCPATHYGGISTDPDALQEGMRIQLDPALDVEALEVPAWQKTIARALQRYGAYLRDDSGSLAIVAENPVSRGYDAWARVGLFGENVSLAGLPWQYVRVLDARSDC